MSNIIRSSQITSGSLEQLQQQKQAYSPHQLATMILKGVNVILLVDTSGSMEDHIGSKSKFDIAREAAENIQRKYPGKTAVMCFSTDAAWVFGGVLHFYHQGTRVSYALELLFDEIKKLDQTSVTDVWLISDGMPDYGDDFTCYDLMKARWPRNIKMSTVFCGRDSDRDAIEFMHKMAELGSGKYSDSTDEKIRLLPETLDRLMLSSGE